MHAYQAIESIGFSDQRSCSFESGQNSLGIENQNGLHSNIILSTKIDACRFNCSSITEGTA